MAKVKKIKSIANYFKRLNDVYLAAHVKTLIAITLDAQKRTIMMAKLKFTGRGGRRLTGQLMRSITSGFEGDFRRIKNITKLPSGFISVAVPYAAIHELGSGGLPGGVIKPKRAKNLWIKLIHTGKFKRITPTEFFRLMNQAETKGRVQSRLLARGKDIGRKTKSGRTIKPSVEDFGIIGKPGRQTAVHMIRKGKSVKVTPLFALRKKVKIPKRPYVGPSIKAALRFYNVKYGVNLAGLVFSRLITGGK